MLAVIPCIAFTQDGLDEMIAAEKSFAAYSVVNNTKDAFLEFMDTSAVMFENGEPFKSYERWMKKKKTQGVLNWWPLYAEISNSGDFGYTCGPWTFQPKTVNDTVVASGYFFTVWKKNEDGMWKFILDVGTEAGPIVKDTGIIKVNTPKTKGTEESLLLAEQEFIELSRGDLNQLYLKFLRGNSVLCKEGEGLIWMKLPWHLAPRILNNSHYTIKGNALAPSGDIGYVYGIVTNETEKDTYLRIWRHTSKGWKLALQLTRL